MAVACLTLSLPLLKSRLTTEVTSETNGGLRGERGWQIATMGSMDLADASTYPVSTTRDLSELGLQRHFGLSVDVR